MGTAGVNTVQSPEEVYRLICTARLRQPVAVSYEGTQRRLCPYVVGRNAAGECRVFCYQYGGESRSEPDLGGKKTGVWRCLSLRKVSSLELLRNDEWRSEFHGPQHCVKHVEIDADAYTAGDPQNGQ